LGPGWEDRSATSGSLWAYSGQVAPGKTGSLHKEQQSATKSGLTTGKELLKIRYIKALATIKDLYLVNSIRPQKLLDIILRLC
jgi:hypothetical protein